MVLSSPAAPSAERVRRLDALAVVVAGFLLFALNVDFLLYGDAALYADLVLRGTFDELTLHIGYFALVYGADRTLGAVFGIPLHETAVWLNVAAGALSLGVAYLLARRFLATRGEALLCVAILALSGRVLTNATTAEIYMTQTLFVLWSYYLFVRERAMAAGMVMGYALLISPLSAFACLFHPVLDYQRSARVRWSVLLRLAAGALLLYLPYLLLFGRELLWGTRGLLTVQHAFPLDPFKLLVGFPKFQFKAYTTLLLLLVPAALALRANRRFLALSLAVALPHLYVVLRIPAQDQVFILNTDFFFTCWLVIGWRELARHPVGRWIAPLALAGHVALMLASGSIFRFESHRSYGEEIRGIARAYLVGRDAVMVTDWSTVRGFSFYVHEAEPGTIDWERLTEQLYDVQNVRRMDPRKLEAAEIYVLDPWRAGPLSRLFRSRRALDEQARRYSIVALADRVLDLRCGLIRESTHRLYRCVRRQAAGQGSPAAAGRVAGLAPS